MVIASLTLRVTTQAGQYERVSILEPNAIHSVADLRSWLKDSTRREFAEKRLRKRKAGLTRRRGLKAFCQLSGRERIEAYLATAPLPPSRPRVVDLLSLATVFCIRHASMSAFGRFDAEAFGDLVKLVASPGLDENGCTLIHFVAHYLVRAPHGSAGPLVSAGWVGSPAMAYTIGGLLEWGNDSENGWSAKHRKLSSALANHDLTTMPWDHPLAIEAARIYCELFTVMDHPHVDRLIELLCRSRGANVTLIPPWFGEALAELIDDVAIEDPGQSFGGLCQLTCREFCAVAEQARQSSLDYEFDVKGKHRPIYKILSKQPKLPQTPSERKAVVAMYGRNYLSTLR